MPLSLAKLQNVQVISDGWQCACPACREDGRDSQGNHLRIWKSGEWNCIVSTGDKDHNRRIWQLAGDGDNCSGHSITVETDRSELDVPTIYPPDCLDRLVKDYSFWERRGIRAETVAPFRGGIATQFTMKDRWVFPQFNEEGEIIGFSGRCIRQLTEEERNWYGRKKWKHKHPSSKFVWGGLEEIDEARRAVLVESIGDGLALRQNGIPENLCLFGTTLSSTVLGWLIAHNPAEIVVATNNDIKHSVGQTAAVKIAKSLQKFFDEQQVRIALPQVEGKKDFGEMTPEEIEAWRHNALDM